VHSRRWRTAADMRKHFSLSLLVLANILPTALILPLAILGVFYSRTMNPLFNSGLIALAGIGSAQLLILAMVTAFHDPRLPASRWLSIAAILFGSAALFAIEGAITQYGMMRSFGWSSSPSWQDDFLVMLYVSTMATSAIFAGGMALILVIHICAWPLRTMWGWRLVRSGELDASRTARQFGITHLLAWVGLCACLLWLLRTAAGAAETLLPLLAVLAFVAVSLLFVLPWTYLLFVSKVKLWPFVVGFAAIPVLSYVAQEAIAQFNFSQISNSKTVASAFLLPSLQITELGAFGCTATLAAAVNFLMLRRLGFRFQSAKANPSPSVASSPIPT
jgi:hypothetical protein